MLTFSKIQHYHSVFLSDNMPKKFSTTKRAPPAILSSTSEEENLEPSPKRPRGVAQSPDATSRHGSPRPSSGDEAHRSPSPVQEVASTRRPASRGRPRLAHFSNEVQQKLVEFYRQHPCLYDLEDPNFKDKELKKRLLEDIASELGIQTKQIGTWFKTERRYYTENVMKPSAHWVTGNNIAFYKHNERTVFSLIFLSSTFTPNSICLIEGGL